MVYYCYKNSHLSYMEHSWPVTVVVVEENAVFLNNSITLLLLSVVSAPFDLRRQKRRKQYSN